MNRGKAFKYGDNVDTDVIIPARYLNSPTPGGTGKTLHGGYRRFFFSVRTEWGYHRRRSKFWMRLFQRTCAYGDSGLRR